MADNNSKNVAVGCSVAALVVILLLCALGGCVRILGSMNDEDEPSKRGGGTVLIQADQNVCWELTAYDERLDEGRIEDYEADDLTSSEEQKAENATVSEKGCGPTQVVLSEATVYGSVALAVDDDDEAHPLRNFALLLWLSRQTKPRGGLIAKPDSGEQYILYSSDASTTYRGSDSNNEPIADSPFGNVRGMQFSKEETEELKKVGMETHLSGTFYRPRVDELMAASGEVADHEANLTALWRTTIAAHTVRAIARREVTPGAEGDYDPSSFTALLATIKGLERGNYGAEWRAVVQPLRIYLADLRLAELRDDVEYAYDGDTYRDAASRLKLLNDLDPARAPRWKKLRAKWLERAAVKDAEAAREDSGGGGGGGGGGDFDFPDSLCPTRFC